MPEALQPIRDGHKVIHPPVYRHGLWVCDRIDQRTGEIEEREFADLAKAKTWFADRFLKAASTPARPDHTMATKSAAARAYCSALDDGMDDGTSVEDGLAAEAGLQLPCTATGSSSGHEMPEKGGAPRKYGVRVGKVREVLEEHGLDPTAELIAVLRRRLPVYRDGKVLLDENGEQVTKPALPEHTVAAILMDLQQYVAPRLKAVEVIQKDDKPRTVEEANAKIEQLLQAREAMVAGAVR